jgi:daunorubicin resistance ABC transporter ATP-binding subunit
MSELAIRAEGLVKRFGDLVALGGIDLDVPRGSVFGLLGPNGAGKTTAVRIFSTILPPDDGRAEVLGHDVVTQAAAVRRRIGLAGQYAAVDANLTGRENLEMVGVLGQLPGGQIRPRATELLAKFDLTDAADRTLKTYSGGMRRRLDIAASLVTRPPVLFLDEPTTGLDLTSRNALWETIDELVADGTTVLLTTQYLEEADRLARRIAVVDGGMVIANDTPENLKAQLGTTVVELRFEGDDASGRASELLSTAVNGQVEREDGTVRISSNDGARILIDVMRTLDTNGVEPETLTVREPSMDDVFLALTGHRAETEDGAPEGAPAVAGGRRGRGGGAA